MSPAMEKKMLCYLQRIYGHITLPRSCADCLKTWEPRPKGLPRPVMGLLCFYYRCPLYDVPKYSSYHGMCWCTLAFRAMKLPCLGTRYMGHTELCYLLCIQFGQILRRPIDGLDADIVNGTRIQLDYKYLCSLCNNCEIRVERTKD
jgi:hypothetical protein